MRRESRSGTECRPRARSPQVGGCPIRSGKEVPAVSYSYSGSSSGSCVCAWGRETRDKAVTTRMDFAAILQDTSGEYGKGNGFHLDRTVGGGEAKATGRRRATTAARSEATDNQAVVWRRASRNSTLPRSARLLRAATPPTDSSD